MQCKWVYKTKLKANGTVERHKARVVAKGFHQDPGVNVGETFSPVAKMTTIRSVLAVAVSLNWKIRQIDMDNAFLNEELKEKIFMLQPEGFVDKQHHDHVCKLNKALYGLKQVPRAWCDKLRSTC